MTAPVWKREVWERVLADQTEKADKARISRHGGWVDVLSFRADRRFRKMVQLAAKGRNISMGGYMRRAIAKQIAQDSGVELSTILALTPFPSEYGKKSAQPKDKPVPDNGEGYGKW